MFHVWLTRGVGGAYANCMPVPELERSLRAFEFREGLESGIPESRPCPQDATPAPAPPPA